MNHFDSSIYHNQSGVESYIACILPGRLSARGLIADLLLTKKIIWRRTASPVFHDDPDCLFEFRHRVLFYEKTLN